MALWQENDICGRAVAGMVSVPARQAAMKSFLVCFAALIAALLAAYSALHSATVFANAGVIETRAMRRSRQPRAKRRIVS